MARIRGVDRDPPESKSAGLSVTTGVALASSGYEN
jgi:hypothetical protein